MVMQSESLLIENVSKSYGEVGAVRSLSASLPRGCIYGFLGPNGAGKTTTIRMIMDIIRPDSGQVKVLGETSIEKARDRVGYMPEERGLYRKMTVRGVISFIGSIHGMSRADAARYTHYWLDELKLLEWADKRVENLSRGMQQKLQFIATVINNPDLLILDEPFSGLDPINLDLLKSIMLRLRNEGKTVIFSTHMMEQAEKLCDYILLISKGQKLIDGTLEQIRSGYETNKVLLEIEGDDYFLQSISQVSQVKKEGHQLEVTLNEGTDTQDFLKSVVDKVRLRSFEIKKPSLHDIFVQLVGGQSNE